MKCIIRKWYYKLLIKLGLYKPLTATEIKERFINNINKLPRKPLDSFISEEELYEIKLNFIRNYLKRLYNEQKESNL